MRDALELASGNPVAGNTLKGVMVFNPAPVAQTICPRISADWLKGSWQHFTSIVHTVNSHLENLDARPNCQIGPVDVPASGYRFIPFAEMREAPPAKRCAMGADFVESPFFRL